MAAKYQLITELYRRTGVAVAKNPQAWQSFLSAACRNYKCRFDEQLLIYAQRPDAVAVAQLETWNKQFKRWVNKDSKGIAVFDQKGRRNTLKYYFDISDTHEGYYGSRPVPIWQMSERYEQAVIERLSDRFGDVESTDLASVLMETAKNAALDNLQDYMPQLKSCTQDSLLEGLDEYNIEVIYRQLAVNSVAYMLMSRCGVDTEAVFEREDFAEIINFNTPATINALGIATSDISEMALREISQTIRDVQIAEKSQNRTFAPQSQTRYDVGREQAERSNHNERNHIHQTRGLSYSRPDITDRARNSAWQIRFNAQGLSGTAQTSDLPQSADIGRAEQTSLRGGTDGSYEAGASDKTALQGAGRDGGTESKSTDAMGRADEQYPQSSGGNDTERADLQLNVADEQQVTVNLPTVEEQIEMLAEAEDEKSSAFVISQEDIDSVLQRGSGFQNGKYRIYRQFQGNEDGKGNIDFLKKEYGTGGGTHYFPDGMQGHTWHDGKGMAIEKYGSSANPDLGIDDVQASKGEQFTVKQLMKTRKGIKAKLDKLNDTKRKDTVIDFEQLGIDRLFIDESHFYKNLYLYTKMRNVGGIAQTEAQKSSDLFMKCRYLDEITGNRGTIFATGTPISNSMVELYSVQRYLQYDALLRNGLQHFDSWASTFGETVTALELATEGTNYRAKTRFAKFYNLPELMQMFREVADIQTADMLKLPVPTVNYHNIKTKPSEIQTEMVASLAKRAEKVRARLVEPNIDNMLKITNDGRKLALDQRMIDPMLPDDPDSKVNACVDNVYRIWEEHADTKATQLVFCDLSTPKNDGTFNVYDDMREKLIARGIPAEQICFIHEATTDAQKKELFGKVRSGEVRVLFGSTPKMGAGTNVQDRLIAIHNLDCPWRPSDVGRILRTFKIKKNVEVTDNGKIII